MPSGSGRSESRLSTPTVTRSTRSGDRRLGGDPREDLQVVRIRVHVEDELAASVTGCASDYPLLDADPVGYDRVAALRDEPEMPVLEDEDRWKQAVDRLVERRDGQRRWP